MANDGEGPSRSGKYGGAFPVVAEGAGSVLVTGRTESRAGGHERVHAAPPRNAAAPAVRTETGRRWKWATALLFAVVTLLLARQFFAGSGGGHRRPAAAAAPGACAFDEDCKAPTGVCDQAAGRCVQCLSNADCPENSDCNGQRCQANVCAGGRFCSNNAVAHCAEDRKSFTIAEPCGKGTCVEAAGSASCLPAAPAAAEDGCRPGLIDDMEQPLAGRLPSCEGRSGTWRTFFDEAPGSWQLPAIAGSPYWAPGASGDGHAMRTHGVCAPGQIEAGVWGAGLGFDLNNPSGKLERRLAYDAVSRGYRGIRFSAKVGETRGATSRVTLRLPDINTDPAGARCSVCYDDYSYDVQLSTTWQSYTVLWSQLKRSGRGVPSANFDPRGITAIHWQFFPGDTYDLVIDDVEFVR